MFRGTLLYGHWHVSQGKEILTTAVIQRGIVCEQAHKEDWLEFTMRPCEQDFDQISSHLPSECDLVSTVIALSCDNVNLSFSSCCGCAKSLEPPDAEES